ncbi:hypothetical protein PIB30_074642 [Stylosanthes scabra]|uniref:Uncharacterized protein n=1 Tax=Stylosanthes scabra TaxID=79078 RepID=A0ABU6YMA1_9FABA|nr:hypothetical protein [Stylosanthes scabra]
MVNCVDLPHQAPPLQLRVTVAASFTATTEAAIDGGKPVTVAVERGRNRVPCVRRREKHVEREKSELKEREIFPSSSAIVLELHIVGVHGGNLVAGEHRRSEGRTRWCWWWFLVCMVLSPLWVTRIAIVVTGIHYCRHYRVLITAATGVNNLSCCSISLGFADTCPYRGITVLKMRLEKMVLKACKPTLEFWVKLTTNIGF